MSIKNLPLEDRPRERLMRLGPENLSLPELIAILLRTGDQKKSALALAQELVQSFQGDQLFRASFDQFLAFDGIQKAKAVPSNEKDITMVRLDRAIREALPCDRGQSVGVRREYKR